VVFFCPLTAAATTVFSNLTVCQISPVNSLRIDCLFPLKDFGF
jgi:hypothetical protein